MDGKAQDDLWAEQSATTLQDSGVPFHEHWRLYQSIFADRPVESGPPIAWRPHDRAASNLHQLKEAVGATSYEALHRWTCDHRADYWQFAIEALGIRFDQPPNAILEGTPTHPTWLPGARFNAAAIPDEGQRPAIVFASEEDPALQTWSYDDLVRRADQISHALVAAGLEVGDAVALYLPMTAECVSAYLAIVRAGMVVVSIPDSFAPAEVAVRLRLGDARLILTVETFRRAGKDVAMADKARAASDVPVVCVDDADWDGFLAVPASFDPVPRKPDAVSNILFSSGTTGEPKAIPWTHLTPIKAAADGHFHQDIHATDVVAWPTNIGWMMGPWLIYAALLNRSTIALYEGAPTGDRFLDFLDESGVTVLGVVPAIVRAWLRAGVEPHRLPKVRVFSSTGEASNAHDYLYLMSLAGYRAPIIEYCGGTEIGGGHLTGTVVQPASPATFTTPALGLDFMILDEEGGLCGPGSMGEIFLVPPSIGLSQRLLNKDHDPIYYDDLPTSPDGRPLRRHGDEVQVLHGGFWQAAGRADDTMNLGGIKVGSIELETVMNGHPDVVETAAVGITPASGGAEQLVVFAVGRDAGGLQADLQKRIKELLNPLFRIHELVMVESLPRTASNKVMRKDLRAQYAETLES